MPGGFSLCKTSAPYFFLLPSNNQSSALSGAESEKGGGKKKESVYSLPSPQIRDTLEVTEAIPSARLQRQPGFFFLGGRRKIRTTVKDSAAAKVCLTLHETLSPHQRRREREKPRLIKHAAYLSSLRGRIWPAQVFIPPRPPAILLLWHYWAPPIILTTGGGISALLTASTHGWNTC